MQNKRGAALPDKGVRAFQVEPDVCGGRAAFLCNTFVSVCVFQVWCRCAFGSRAQGGGGGGGGWVESTALPPARERHVYQSQFLQNIFTCSWADGRRCSMRMLEAELKYGAGAARLEKAAGTFGKSFIQILHPCHLNPSYGEQFRGFNYTEQLSECVREGFCPSLMAPIRAKERQWERKCGRWRLHSELHLKSVWTSLIWLRQNHWPVYCVNWSRAPSCCVLCESLLIRAASLFEFK